jgi:hypothetical protein
VFYVENGYVRGYAEVLREYSGESLTTCEVTFREWGGKYFVFMEATSWTWIKPIPMKGFQGWRYFDAPEDIQVVGGWLDNKPEVQ